PGIFRRKGKARRVGEPLHLFIEPAAASGFLQLLDHSGENGGEVRNVRDRVVDLTFVERTSAPVGEAGALVETMTEQAFDQVRIADLLAVAEGHGRDLRIE